MHTTRMGGDLFDRLCALGIQDYPAFRISNRNTHGISEKGEKDLGSPNVGLVPSTYMYLYTHEWLNPRDVTSTEEPQPFAATVVACSNTTCK